MLETKQVVGTFDGKLFEEVTIFALVNKVDDGGVLTIHVLVEPNGLEPVEDLKEEYFGKDVARKVFSSSDLS